MLGAAGPPLCITHLHLEAVPSPTTTGAGSHMSAELPVPQMEILQGVMLQFVHVMTGSMAY